MCGRYASFRQTQDLAEAFAIRRGIQDVLPLVDLEAAALPPSWNVAPTDTVRIVVEREPGAGDGPPVRSVRLARWGLVPSWSKDPSGGARLINARSETLLEKPSFARAAESRRCLVVADGYFEWRRAQPGAARRPVKQPFYIHPPGGAVLAFAGLYEFWRDRSVPDDDPARWLVSTTIITGAAEGELGELHERRPIALPPGRWEAWLDPGVRARDAVATLQTPAPDLELRPVSTEVNRVGTQGPHLLDPVTDAG